MDSDPYLVALARQGRRRSSGSPARRLADPADAAEDVPGQRDLDPYLVELARNARGTPDDCD